MFFSIFKKDNLKYDLGAIIGEINLVSCTLVTPEFSQELKKIDLGVYRRSNHTETYSWKLENVKKYD